MGQSETLVRDLVDSFLVLLLPGAGDELQGIKRGIMEVADVVAIQKADGDAVQSANLAAATVLSALRVMRARTEGWEPRVHTCSALEGSGLDDVWSSIQAHRTSIAASGWLERERTRQRKAWLWNMVDETLHKPSQRSKGCLAGRRARGRGGSRHAKRHRRRVADLGAVASTVVVRCASLASLKLRRAFLYEGRDAFPCVFGREQSRLQLTL